MRTNQRLERGGTRGRNPYGKRHRNHSQASTGQLTAGASAKIEPCAIDSEVLLVERRKLTPSGKGGRSIILLASTGIGALVSCVLIGVGFTTGGEGVLLICAGCVVAAIYLWLWARFAWVGVVVGKHDVIARSWWRRRTIERSSIVRFSSESYMGWLYVTGWPVAAGPLEPASLHVTTASGEVISLAGTVTWRRTARLQSEHLNRLIGAEIGTGDGPRRRSR